MAHETSETQHPFFAHTYPPLWVPQNDINCLTNVKCPFSAWKYEQYPLLLVLRDLLTDCFSVFFAFLFGVSGRRVCFKSHYCPLLVFAIIAATKVYNQSSCIKPFKQFSALKVGTFKLKYSPLSSFYSHRPQFISTYVLVFVHNFFF